MLEQETSFSVDRWVADRTRSFDSSGIREVFNLAKKLKNPVNLSIGQPDFDVPAPVKASLIRAIEDGKNGYTQTQGIAPLQHKLQSEIDEQFGHDDRKVFVCSGTSGGLVLTFMSLINPGDEVLFFDPFLQVEKEFFIDKHIIYNGRHILTEVLTGAMQDYGRPREMSLPERQAFLAAMFRVSGW